MASRLAQKRQQLSPLALVGIFSAFIPLVKITPGPKNSTENGEWFAWLLIGAFIPLFFARTGGKTPRWLNIVLEAAAVVYLCRFMFCAAEHIISQGSLW